MKNLRPILIAILFALIIPIIPTASFAKGRPIAVMPWKVNAAGDMEFVKNALYDMLSTRLAAKDFDVIGRDLVNSAITDAKEITETSALSAGKKLNAELVLFGSLTILGNAVSLDAKLLDVKDGSTKPFYMKENGLDAVVGMADRLSNDVSAFVSGVPAPSIAAKPVEEKAPAPPVKKEDEFIIKAKEDDKAPASLKTSRIEGLFTGVVAEDLNKDGEKEFFLLSEKKLIIAKVKSGSIEVIKEIKADLGADNVSITSIDSDNDGSIEVYVSRVRNNKPDSFAIEFRDNDYKATVSGIKWLLRTIKAGKSDLTLIGQSFRKDDGLYGPLKRLKKHGAEISDNGPFEIAIPRKVSLYSFEAFDLMDSGELNIVALDDRDYVKVYANKDGKWVQEWKSPEYFGGTLNTIRFREDAPGVTEKEPALVEGRFFHADLNNDGKAELIIKRNVPGGLGRSATRPASFVSGEVMSLSWAGENLAENWKTRTVPGYISDFFIDDLDGDGTKEITLLIVEGTENLFGTRKSYILSYKISI